MSYAASAPFEIGRVIQQTFGVIGRNAPSILLPSFAAAVVSVLGSYGLGLAVGTVFGPTVASIVVAALLGVVIGLVVKGLLASCLTLVVVGDLNGRRTDVGAVLGAAARMVGPVIAVSLLMALGVGFASLLLVVPGILLLLMWLVAVPVRVMEGRGVTASLSRSSELTAGNRWRLFGLLVLYALLLLLITFVVGALGIGGAQAVGGRGFEVATLAVQVVISTITSAIGSSGTATIYAELRRAKEGVLPNQLAAVFE